MKPENWIAAVILVGTVAWAGDGSGPRQVPQVAVAACSGLAAQNGCSVTTADGQKLEGKCAEVGDPQQLACVGEGAVHHRPPPEAFKACEGVATGAACTADFKVAGRRHLATMSGTCEAGPNGEPAACRPSAKPRQ